MPTENQTTYTNLSLVQQKVLLLLEQMRPFDKIEIRKTESEDVITTSSTTKETFPN